MLSRSSLSIRRLVPHRPEAQHQENESFFDDEDDMANFKKQFMQRKPSTRFTGKSRRKPSEPIIVPRPTSIHKISDSVPPLPTQQDSPRTSSSSSSLSSVDGYPHHRTELPSRRRKGSRKDSLCSPRGSVEESTPPTTPPKDIPEERRQTLLKRPFLQTSFLSSTSDLGESHPPSPLEVSPEDEEDQAQKLDALEATNNISPTTPTNDTTNNATANTTTTTITTSSPVTIPVKSSPTQDKLEISIKSQYDYDEKDQREEVSENVRQLIRETNKAFKAVGAALDDARAASVSPKSSPRSSPRFKNQFDPSDSKTERPLPPLPPASPANADKPELPVTNKGEKTLPPTPASPPADSAETTFEGQQEQQQQTNATPPLKSPSPKRTSTFTPTISITTPCTNNASSPAASTSKLQAATKTKKTKKSRKASEAATQKMARWGFSENVTDIFSGQIFRKIEVDEMLTPEQLREIQASKEFQLRQRQSSEDNIQMLTDTEGSDTPIEPFHLEDLSSRLGAAGIRTSIELPKMSDSPSTSTDHAVVRRDSSFSIPRKTLPPRGDSLKGKWQRQKRSDETEDSQPVRNDPSKLHVVTTSKGPAAQSAEVMPTIPEVFVASPAVEVDDSSDDQISLTTHETETSSHTGDEAEQETKTEYEGPFAPIEAEDFMFFHSTPYTYNLPDFRHGLIRFPKSEIARFMKMSADETLDWTAFQMAILGCAGDNVYLTTERSDDDEVEDVASWFDDFGFYSTGGLLTSEEDETLMLGEAPSSTVTAEGFAPNVRRPSSVEWGIKQRQQYQKHQSKTSLAVTPEPDSDLPIPLAKEFPAGIWNEGGADTAKFPVEGPTPSSRHLRTRSNIKRRPSLRRPPPRKRYNSQASIGSMPQSPMMDLVFFSSGEEEGKGDFVPMGCNLDHDLDDYLRWEAENVYFSAGVR